MCVRSFCHLLNFDLCRGLPTGHNTLRRHLYLLGLQDNPLCRKCGVMEETSAHVLCENEALASLRHAYMIFINCNWVVTWWQYTFTHK